MKIAFYTRDSSMSCEERICALAECLRADGHEICTCGPSGVLPFGTDMVLAVGGDGTFLSCASVVGDSGVPVLGVNMGRLGFLSENVPEAVVDALHSGKWRTERRSLLQVLGTPFSWPYALNEVSVHRSGAAMLGVDVSVNGAPVPTYWADGLLVATSSGSTAYSLSVGGPIVTPDSRVLIIAPIAPHNLNVRPLVVPDSSVIDIRFRSRDAVVLLDIDNRTCEIPADSRLCVHLAQFSLNRVCLGGSDFIKALTSKLYWGEDIRNGNE